MAFISNLYPPIVMDTLPAFVRTENCRIYFSLSNYTSETDIKNVQVTVTNIISNQSALDSDMYPSNIKICELNTVLEPTDQFKYYIEISPEDLVKPQGYVKPSEENSNEITSNNESSEEEIVLSFGLNQTYKVQLRFTSKNIPQEASANEGTATWFNDYKDWFSEWSSICLIKGISQPIISLRGFDESTPPTENERDYPVLEMIPTQLVGNLSFVKEEGQKEQEKETLDSYKVQIYIRWSNSLVYQSKVIYTNEFNSNEINFALLYNFQPEIDYIMKFSYRTINSYTQSKYYKFQVPKEGITPIPINIAVTPQQDIGCINIALTSVENTTFEGTLLVKRTSSKANFMIWEDIKQINYPEAQTVEVSFQDPTVESGVWYKYRVQKKNPGNEDGPVELIQPIMIVFDDIYIIHNDTQLKIQFNPKISDFKYNISQSQQVTLGSKFPFIRVNGNSKYRSFSLGGLISSLSDRNDWYSNNVLSDTNLNNKPFANKTELYGGAAALYEQYNVDNNVSDYLDIIYEKVFRDKVYDFLYGNNVKLFKSTTEGNILIRLSNVSFQPMDSLGRSIYSFTATATEIDEANLENYIKYGIISDFINLDIITLAPAITFNNQGILTIDAYGIEPKDQNNINLYLEEVFTRGGRWK